MAAYLEIQIPALDPDHRDLLIQELEGLGFQGFEEAPDGLRAYAPEGTVEEGAVSALLESKGLAFSRRVLPEQNWNEVWEAGFVPVRIGNFCGVRAEFHDPIPGVRYELVITPKMSFGTGHHETTCLMIEAMEHLPFEGKRVMDFGTGTGILAILAFRLGAPSVTAIDNDPWSVDNALENTARNGAVPVKVLRAEDLSGFGETDVILANINRRVLLAEMNRMAGMLAPGGRLLLSGILTDDSEVLRAAAAAEGLTLVAETVKGSWVAQLWKK